ncbi:hypothetical protein J3B02_003419, partial [Coemansia erecta]
QKSSHLDQGGQQSSFSAKPSQAPTQPNAASALEPTASNSHFVSNAQQQMQQFMAMANMDPNGGSQPPLIHQTPTPVPHSMTNSFQSQIDHHQQQQQQQQQHQYNALQWQQQLMPQNITSAGNQASVSASPGAASVNVHQRRTDGGADQIKNSGNGAQVAIKMTSPTQTSQPPAQLSGMKKSSPTITSANHLLSTTASAPATAAAVPISMAPGSATSTAATAVPAATIASVLKKAPTKAKAKRGAKKTSAKGTAAAAATAATATTATTAANNMVSSQSSHAKAAMSAATANAAPDRASSPHAAKSGGVSNSESSGSGKTNGSPALAIKASSALAASVAGKNLSVATPSPSFANGLPLGSGAANAALADSESQFGGMTENAFSTLLSQRGSQATLHGGAVGISNSNDIVSAMNVNVSELNLHLNEWFGDNASTEALNEILNMGATLGANAGSMSHAGEHRSGNSGSGRANGNGNSNNGNGGMDSSQILGGYNINDPAAFSNFISAGGANNSSSAGSLSNTLSMAMPMSIGMPISAAGGGPSATGTLNVDANNGTSNNVFSPATATSNHNL